MENQPNDIELRANAFNDELRVLLAKYRLALGAQVFFTSDGRIGARPQLLDDSLNREGKRSINKAKHPQ